MDKQLITLGAKIELARRRFFFYAQLKNPDFYRSDRKYLQELCDTLQWFLTSDKKILVLNMPPRHGKSYTASNFVEWALGRDNTLQVMIGSYNETLSTRFSKNVRDSISEAKADIYKPVYSDVFPATKIKRGDGAMNLWSLEGQQTSYLATSPTGTATGFGCRLMIIDDLIKNAEEAYNENVKEKHWDWFTNTMLSRGEGNYKIIVIMTRWASDDLAGKVLGRKGLKAWEDGEDWRKYMRGYAGLREVKGRLHTFEMGALISVQEYFKLEEEAKQTYARIIDCGKNDFASKIHKNTGYSISRLNRIFEHVFITKHELQSGTSTFLPDPDMADSFTRLLNGKDIRDCDIILLNHEHLELAIMKKMGYNYSEAHILAEKKYNYKAAIDKRYDSNGKNYST